MDTTRARMAGERALRSLEEARGCLSSAKNWGLLDILGGRGFSGLVKHAKLSKAQRVLDQARFDLAAFKSELSYIPAVDIEIGSFLAFADFFFDGLLADLMVQSKISKAIVQTDEAIRKTREALARL